MSAENKEMLDTLKDISINVGNILSNIEYIKQENIDIKQKLERLILSNINHDEDIKSLKERIASNEEKIKDLYIEIGTLKASTYKFDKLDNKIFRFKRVITYLTYDNPILRVIYTGLISTILVMLILMFIDYVAIRVGLSKEVTEVIKNGINK